MTIMIVRTTGLLASLLLAACSRGEVTRTADTHSAMAGAGAESSLPANGMMASSSAANDMMASQRVKADMERQVDGLTSAPRRLIAVAELNASLEEVWAYISNHDNLLEYTNGVLGNVSIDRSQSQEHNGVGTMRQCEVNGERQDKFVERVVYFRAPYAFAYSAFENTWGLENHLATVYLQPTASGGTRVEWSQYFDGPTAEANAMLTKNIAGMLEGPVFSFFTERFGGRVLPSAS